ncbi:MAG: hypothetical protein NTW87_08450, partial [Planctomycetota bacterium]|nr:hypothetical protein [Planctomycetota bacterium]
MHGRCPHLFVLLLLTLVRPDAPALAGDEKPPDANLLPLSVVVLDDATGEPVTEFSYSYWIETAGQRERGDTGDGTQRDVKCPDGIITLKAPPSCQFLISVKSRDYICDFPYCRTYTLKAEAKERRIVVKLTRGVTVSGTVLDARTKKPIAGAKISPIVPMPPLFVPDRERFAISDGKGKYELHGVSSSHGISVSHPDYLDGGAKLPAGADKANAASVDVQLEQSESFRGTVTAPDGKPLAGVKISDGAGKEIQSGLDGSFALRSPKKWWNSGKEYYLTFQNDGYIERRLNPKQAPAEAFTVVMQPLFDLTGQVLAPDGKPVTEYAVTAGPGKNPPDFHCAEAKVKHAEGRFSLRLEKHGEHWIGVRA